MCIFDVPPRIYAVPQLPHVEVPVTKCRFHVTFNEQEFLLGGAVRFRIQILQHPTHLTTVALGEQKHQHEHQVLTVSVKLLKHNPNPTQNKQQIMQSTQSIIKNNELESPREQSAPKQKHINKKAVQTVAQVKVNVGVCGDGHCFQGSTSMFQVLNTQEQQYFGKLYYLINHVRLGYLIRNPQIHLGDIQNIQNGQLHKHQRQRQRQRKQKQKNYSDKSNNTNDINVVLSRTWMNICQMYRKVIKQQIKQLHRLQRMQIQLGRALPHQDQVQIQLKMQSLIQKSATSPHKWHRDSRNNKNKQSSPTAIQISLPQKQIYGSTQRLSQYYECDGLQELYLTVYGQSVHLYQIVKYQWFYVMGAMGKQKWGAHYYQRTVNTLAQAIGHIGSKSNRVDDRIYKPLKYSYYVYESVPDLQTIPHKHKHKQKQMGSIPPVSSQHTLFILVHGFNGNEHDMGRIKSYLGYFCTPHFLVLKTISGRILDTLDTIGQTAATQIKEYLRIRVYVKRINFIGFSLGGVVLRACLPYLREYHHLFNMLITLSSPHLGVRGMKSCIVKTGMHLVQRVKGIKNIKQLLLDSKLPTSAHQDMSAATSKRSEEYDQQQICYLQHLAKDTSLSSFNLVVVCGAEEDKYVPAFSAVIQYEGDNERMVAMQASLKQNIRNLHQIYVKFNSKNKGTFWDRISGRRVHINFLDDDAFLHAVIGRYFTFF